MSLKKQFLKSKPVCKVTFSLSAENAGEAKKVLLLGDFNNWKANDAEMKKGKDGSFSKTVELATEQSYEFRYLVDESNWVNDDAADSYVHSGVANDENSVVKV